MVWPDGSYYEGQFDHNMIHGKGTKYVDKESYEGMWKHNKKYGRGKITFAHGDTIEGEFLNDEYLGEYKYTFKDGRVLGIIYPGAKFQKLSENWD